MVDNIKTAYDDELTSITDQLVYDTLGGLGDFPIGNSSLIGWDVCQIRPSMTRIEACVDAHGTNILTITWP